MSVEEIMKEHGVRISASCAGQAWYTKFVQYEGRRAYITVMDETGDGLPQTLNEPVQVGCYDLRSGEEVASILIMSSLNDYLESLED